MFYEQSSISRLTQKVTQGSSSEFTDFLTVEEPLEIQIVYGPWENRQQKTIAITMRTPGEDLYLAIGFLFNESIIHDLEDIQQIVHSGSRNNEANASNLLRIELKAHCQVELKSIEKNFYTNSSCGLCGKTSIQSLTANYFTKELLTDETPLSSHQIYAFPELLEQKQKNFNKTGGIHAAAIYDQLDGSFKLFEDIGRHNALDKLSGYLVQQKTKTNIHKSIIFSGRIGFELMQKTLNIGIAKIIAMGAPSNLAVSIAEKFNMTLIGFTKKSSYNIYCGNWRIKN